MLEHKHLMQKKAVKGGLEKQNETTEQKAQ